MNRRDRKLIEKVGKYYLQYKGVVNLKELISTFEGTEEIPLDDYTLSYIYYYILYLVAKEAVESAKDALQDKLTYREFTVDYSEELFGAIDVVRTINVYPMNLVAYYTFVEGPNAPEYSILGYLLRRIYSMIIEKKEKLPVPAVHPYFDFLQEFEKTLRELDDLKERFPEGYFRQPTYTDPEWLTRAYRAYYIARELEEIRVGFKNLDKPVNKNLIKFMLWKLYELYVFYLVVTYLQTKGYTVLKEGKGIYVATRGDRRLKFVFNEALSNSNLKKIDKIKDKDLEKYRGRPDLSLMEERPIIFECKYSTNVSYITMGRFKVIAYTYEYNPLVAILVYPGLKEKPFEYDGEDSATRELDNEARKNGKVLDFLYNSHLIYMAIVDPSEKEKDNLSVIDKILGKFI